MPRKVFVAGEILTAADVNTNLMDQTVMVFAGTAARGSAIPTPTEGMVTYLSDSNLVEAYTGSAFTSVGTILQVVSTTKTDTFTASSTTFTDVTGLNVSITPKSNTSKVYISAIVSGGSQAAAIAITGRLMRDSTAIAIGDAVGSRTQSSFEGITAVSTIADTYGVQFLDAPATTSAITYKIQVRANSAGTVHVNRSFTDSDATTASRTVSSITVIEVAG